jgi:hypothetical protein
VVFDQPPHEHVFRVAADLRVVCQHEIGAARGQQAEARTRQCGTETVALALVEGRQVEVRCVISAVLCYLRCVLRCSVLSPLCTPVTLVFSAVFFGVWSVLCYQSFAVSAVSCVISAVLCDLRCLV